jgi:transposase
LIWPHLSTRRVGYDGADWPHLNVITNGLVITKGLRVRSRVELFAAIRRDARVDGLSIRELAVKHHVHRRTVRQALGSAIPPPRKTPTRRSPRLESFKTLIDEMLRSDLDAPRKQRHTARRVLGRLVDEHGALELSYSTVRDYVAKRRPEILAESGRAVSEAFVPQTHLPGAEAEVDFADLWVVLRGLKTKVFLFTLRLSFSGKAVHRVFATQGQEAFLEGHVYAFEQLGGTPVEQIRYDNLKSAVSRVLLGRDREESQRWIAFRSHYGFDAFYCQPGVAGAHEKGGVEGEGGRLRRTHCVPMPVVDSIAELNELLAAADAKDDHRRIANRSTAVGAHFAFERDILRPLPGEVFPTWLTLTPRVDRYARITVRQCQYSVPARFIGHRVRVQLGASLLVVFDARVEIARHERATARGGQILVLDHYLEVLARKPGALPGATALAQARTGGAFTPTHDAFWAAARKALGDSTGTRALIEVLLLHRHLQHADVLAGISAALSVGSVSADVVAVEARKMAQQRGASAPPVAATLRPQQVVSLTERRLADLPGDDRPLPSVDAYDDLLGKASS